MSLSASVPPTPARPEGDDVSQERRQLEQAIAALEAQRVVLGEAVVEPLIAVAREKLATLVSQPPAPAGVEDVSRQRKQITVLFADVSGFTAMSETMDAEELSDTMNDLWRRLDGAITSHGGYIDKHIGDAVMALFGAPTAREDDPERAILAALAMQAALAGFRTQVSATRSEARDPRSGLAMRIGINTGPVLLGQVGTTAEYTAMGDTVNLASRLEHAAPVGGILISHDSFRHVRGLFEVKTLDPITIRGKKEPVQVYEVRGVKPRAFRAPTRGVEGIETAMVGRQAELASLQQALQAAIEQHAMRVVVVAGEAGVGKSRLLYEFGRWLAQSPAELLTLRGRADQRTSKLPYALIRDTFALRFDIRNSDEGAVARDKLEEGLVGLAQAAGQQDGEAEVRLWAHFIGHMLGFDFSASPHLRGILDDARQIRNRAFHYLVQLFTALTKPAQASGRDNVTKPRPAALFLEDVHWADEASLELVEHLAAECRHLPVLIVALARPSFFEQRPVWQTGLAACVLRLEPLSTQDSHRLVEEILAKVDRIPPQLHELIISRAEGSPYYIEELIKMLIEEGVIVKGERWRVEAERLTASRVPPTLVGVLQARLDGLPIPERTSLQCAAVVGRAFWDGALASLSAFGQAQETARPVAERGEAHSTLHSLCERELIFRRERSAFAGQQEYIFKHPLLHDVAYESVLKQQRRAYHAQAAAWLIEQSGERLAEYSGLIGEHYERAGQDAQAADWYGRAGKQAQEAGAPQVAIDYYNKALAFLPGGAENETMRRMDYYRGLGLALKQQARFDQAVEAYTAMASLAEAAGDFVTQAQAWDGLSQVQFDQGDYRAALASARRAEGMARQAGEPGHKALAGALCSQCHALSNLGEMEAALALGEQALALGVELNARRVMADSLNLLGWVHKTLGRYQQATHHFEEALALFRELGDRTAAAGALNNLGTTAASCEDYETAVTLLQDALSIAREIGNRQGEIIVLNNLGEAHTGLRDYQAAETHLVQAIHMAEAAGWGGRSESYCTLSQVLMGQGKSAEAFIAAQQALQLGQESGGQEDVAGAWRALGLVLVANESPGSMKLGDETLDAAACFAKSLQIFTETGMEGERARTLRAWAAYEIEKGDRSRGQERLQEAQEILDRLGVRRCA
ncbi:MAG: tetratricopeptide repeat protein [Thermoflexales bacterium]|nr:tetratricopeptide repeat protein [Thermoflexales bacterium]